MTWLEENKKYTERIKRHYGLLEESDRTKFIQPNPNLTDEQKSELIALFKKRNDLGNDIKWGSKEVSNWTYDKFKPYVETSKQSGKEFWKNGLEGIKEGVDYILLHKGSDYTAYQPLTWRGAVTLASNSVEPEIWTPMPAWSLTDDVKNLTAFPFGKPDHPMVEMDWSTNPPTEKREYADADTLFPGAKWCIAMQTSDESWKEYTEGSDKYCFIIACNAFDKNYTYDDYSNFQKIAIKLPTRDGVFDLSQFDNNDIVFFNADDDEISVEDESWHHNWIDEEADDFQDYYTDTPFGTVEGIIYDCAPKMRI